jgi:FKBP-type peptidyl-prolyl cis-trans isomerase SlyD
LHISKNKVVYVTYSIQDEKGEIFEQSDLPVAYIQGSDKGLFLKVEAALEGCKVNDRVSVVLTSEEGFGERDESLIFTDDINNVPPEYRKIGEEVSFQNENGDVKNFIVSSIDDKNITINGNHALAGQSVTFNVTVTDIHEATQQELLSGEPATPGNVLH